MMLNFCSASRKESISNKIADMTFYSLRVRNAPYYDVKAVWGVTVARVNFENPSGFVIIENHSGVSQAKC